MELNFSDFSSHQIYHLMTQTIIPRPIAWVLTDSGEKNYNLAPFSYFSAVSSAPPLMMFSAGKKPSGEIKDTVKNVVNTKQCVIHIASQEDADLVTATAATLEHGDSEVLANEVELVEFTGFDLPRIKHCSIAYGCELFEVKEIGDTPQSLVFVQVKTLHINDEVVSLDAKQRLKVFADKVSPLARLGGGEYAGITEPFAIVRPQ
ncbi:flavin reductase family protein [Veronia pacifica]|uniref:Protein/domain typically associated with flavoprotein oxygenase, DIM6/NTAB family protein n=1 Tax=Veronia pacifica TaxID=1080227 RepID=A0A1C3ECZ7_9GAMM|nr:flavin reductase family protein [Veronia pacifica]ODA31101.1 protein/domain typically associated with flavoprotein oxygenase, DIM6/NTAB family protein [Veronia pacifica]